MATSHSGKLTTTRVTPLSFAEEAELGSIVASTDNTLFVADLDAAQSNHHAPLYRLADSSGSDLLPLFLDMDITAIPQGLALQEVDNHAPVVWLTDYATPFLYWFDTQTSTKGKIDLGSEAGEAKSRGLACGKFGHESLIVLAQEGNGKGHIFVVDAKSRTVLADRTQPALPKSAPTNILLDTAHSRAFVGDYVNSRVSVFDPTKPAKNNALLTLDLTGTVTEGTVYGLALNPVTASVWALDSGNNRLYQIKHIDSTPAVDPVSIDVSFGTLQLSGFWDLAIDAEGYLWMPCRDLSKAPSILQLNPQGHFVGVYPVLEDSTDPHSKPASYLDTLTIAPLNPGQTHDVICVTNRSPAAIFAVRPGTIAGDHVKGPNPDGRVESKNLVFSPIPAVLKAKPNGDFPAFKIKVVDGKNSNIPVSDCVLELSINDVNTPKRLSFVPAKAGVHSTEDFVTVVTDAEGIATLAAGALKAGPNVDKTLKIAVTTRGAVPGVVPCEIAAPLALNNAPDAEEWARRTTGRFNLKAGTVPVSPGAVVTFMLPDEHFNDGARFIESNAPHDVVDAKTIDVKADNSGVALAQLKAGDKLKDYTITASAPDAAEPVTLKLRHVKAAPTQLHVRVTAVHALEYGHTRISVAGMDDNGNPVAVPDELIHCKLANVNASGTIIPRDQNKRCSFLDVGESSQNLVNPRFWSGSTNNGLECELRTDHNGEIDFPPVPDAHMPGIRLAPQGDYVSMTVSLVEGTTPPVGPESDKQEIRH